MYTSFDKSVYVCPHKYVTLVEITNPKDALYLGNIWTPSTG